MNDAIVVENLTKRFRGRHGDTEIVAVDNVSFTVPAGSTLGIVGESGSGKSTVARCLLGLTGFDGGHVEVLGRTIENADKRDLRKWRRDMQVVFQEPYEALNPRFKVGQAIAEPLQLHSDLSESKLRRRVDDLLGLVQLRPQLYDRHPHQLSGGQQQRVNIARAIATNPKVVILDEPTSSLDVSIRAEILKLLVRLQHELGLTYVLISHDLSTIRSVSDRVVVMYLGRIVENGPAVAVLRHPEHPYTEFLLGSELSLNPQVKPKLPAVTGEARVQTPRESCIFIQRCPLQVNACAERQPPLIPAGPEHVSACIFAGAGTERRLEALADGPGVPV